MKRCFEKISYNQFKKDITDDNKLYNEYKLPIRKTKASAGYDFMAINDEIIEVGQIIKMPTGVKVKMNKDEVLMLFVRSSMGFKYNVRLCNQVGIIESDYYNNVTNEGHLWVCLQNHGNKDFVIKKGDAYLQGIFMNFLTVDNEKEIEQSRVGGFGSTGGIGNER